jgi:hypothetical protein
MKMAPHVRASQRSNKIGIVIALFILAFAVWILYSTLQGPRYRVRVCMSYQSRSSCRTVSAKSEQAALQSAVENACADITSGVTETIACQQSQPATVEWLRRPQ